ncbi:uncharacterized protein CLUP02_07681 [Colletotrichum lupini]|uniref:Uncharacterized protein n=1 Tax=Colletotrichum lupini TaxID=145971 RepID=A0A9Q8WG69_9PEZI|nr:uncharacterized protein CLUP02_07681 [Colletotrichum lupini]UQC82194.1 hypothetical protein CLUP02_07681 [Colletotrichum lupini]
MRGPRPMVDGRDSNRRNTEEFTQTGDWDTARRTRWKNYHEQTLDSGLLDD